MGMSVDVIFLNLGLYTGFILLGSRRGTEHKSEHEGFHEFQGKTFPTTSIVRNEILKTVKEFMVEFGFGF